jgi:hypothetical protein
MFGREERATSSSTCIKNKFQEFPVAASLSNLALGAEEQE